MKKFIYEAPTMESVELQIEGTILELSASGSVGVSGYVSGTIY